MPFNILMFYAPQRDLDRALMILKQVANTCTASLFYLSPYQNCITPKDVKCVHTNILVLVLSFHTFTQKSDLS